MTVIANSMKSHWPVSVLSTLSSLVSMALPLILVRSLDATTLGLFKIFFLYLMVLPPLTLISGVSSGLSYWAGRGEVGLKAIRVSALLYLGISVVTLLLLLLFRNNLSSQLHVSVEWVVLFAFALFVGIASLFYDEASIATGRIWMGAVFNSGFEFFRTAVIVITAVSTHSLVAIVKAHIAVQALKMLIGYAFAYRQKLFKFEWDSKIFKEVQKYALPVSTAFIFGLGLNYSDQIILSRLISNAEFALYAVCCLTVPPILVLEASVTRVLIPQLSQAFSENKTERAAAYYRKSVDELSFLIIPAVTGMIVFAAPIIELLFTQSYLAGTHFLQLYSLWYLTLVIPPDAIARARGQAKWILWNFIFFSIFTLGLCGVFASQFGAIGALLGLLFARFISRLYTVYYMKKVLSVRVKEFIPLQSMLVKALICLFLGGVSLGLKQYFSSPLVWLAVCGGGFALFYFISVFKFAPRWNLNERKVLMLTPGLFIGGLEKMILNLSRGLKTSSEWKPQVLAYDSAPAGVSGGNLLNAFAQSQIPVDSKCKPARFSLKTVTQIAQQVWKDRVTVVHTHDLGALIYGVLAKILLFRRIKLVHTQHSFVHLNRSWKYKYYEKFFSWFADSLAVVSEDTRSSYLNLGVSSKKIHFIPNGVDFPTHSQTDRASRITNRAELIKEVGASRSLGEYVDDFWILYLARIHGRKGQAGALKIWNSLSADVRERSVLVFVGPETESGALKNLEDVVSQSANSERVIIAGSSQNPHAWMKSCDLFLSCSEFEGMPLAPIEAVGSGVPAVLSQIPGHGFLAKYAETYPLQEPQQGAFAIERVVQCMESDDAKLREVLWKKTQEVRDSFTLNAMSHRYVKLYEAKI